MKGWLFIMISIILVISCGRNDKKPKILSKEEMGKVTWDIMLVDEHANGLYQDSTIKNLDSARLSLYLKVFQIHKISRGDYNASLRHYAAKPDQMKIIIDSLYAKGERDHSMRTSLPKPANKPS